MVCRSAISTAKFVYLRSILVVERKEPDGATTYYVPNLDAEEVIDVFVNACALYDPCMALHALNGALTLAKSISVDRFWKLTSFHEMLVGYLRHPSLGIRCTVFEFLLT